MDISYCDSVLDFDLDILTQPGNEITQPVIKCKPSKSVSRIKEKIIATDLLIKRYCAKKTLLQDTQKELHNTKEECKQACLEYRDASKKLTSLEEDVRSLILQNKTLQDAYDHSEIKQKAMQSHANQMQVLLKQYEQQIETLKSETKLINKGDKTKLRKEKEIVSSRQQEENVLLEHLNIFAELITENKKPNKLQKALLKKYKKSLGTKHEIICETDDNHSISEDSTCDEILSDKNQEAKSDNISVQNDINENGLRYGGTTIEAFMKQLHAADEGDSVIEVSKIKISDICNFDPDLDVSNEIPNSIDTGRGSSLALSDIEKGFSSPEYTVINSPLSIDSMLTCKEMSKFVSTASSPITVSSVQDFGTSPIKFIDYKNIGVQSDMSPKKQNQDKYNESVSVQCDLTHDENFKVDYLQKSSMAMKEIKAGDRYYKNVGVQYDLTLEKHCEVNNLEKNARTTEEDIANKLFKNVGVQNNILNKDHEYNHQRKPLISKDKVTNTETQYKSIGTQLYFTPSQGHMVHNKQAPLFIIDHEDNQDKTDMEVNAILRTMRLSFDRMSPIPPSPVPLMCQCTCEGRSLQKQTNEHQLSSQIATLTKMFISMYNKFKEYGIKLPNLTDNTDVNLNNDALIPSQIHSAHLSCSDVNDHSFVAEVNVSNVKHTLQKDDRAAYIHHKNPRKEKKQSNTVNGKVNNILRPNKNDNEKNDNSVTMEVSGACSQEIHVNSPRKQLDNNNSLNKSYEKTRTTKIKKTKLTKLQRMKKNMVTKCKIRRESSPLPSKLRSRLLKKPAVIKENSSKVENAALNDKSIYEKALKVVAEMRQKQKEVSIKKSMKRPNSSFSTSQKKRTLASPIKRKTDKLFAVTQNNENSHSIDSPVKLKDVSVVMSPIKITNSECLNTQEGKQYTTDNSNSEHLGTLLITPPLSRQHMKNENTHLFNDISTSKSRSLSHSESLPYNTRSRNKRLSLQFDSDLELQKNLLNKRNTFVKNTNENVNCAITTLSEEEYRESKKVEANITNITEKNSSAISPIENESVIRQSKRLCIKRASAKSETDCQNKCQKRRSVGRTECSPVSKRILRGADTSIVSLQKYDNSSEDFTDTNDLSDTENSMINGIAKTIPEVEIKEHAYKSTTEDLNSCNSKTKNLANRPDIKSYSDLEMFSENTATDYDVSITHCTKQMFSLSNHDRLSDVRNHSDIDVSSKNTKTERDHIIESCNERRDSSFQKGYFCHILEKYVKTKKKKYKPLSGTTINGIYIKLETNIEQINSMGGDKVNETLKNFAESLQDLNAKYFVSAVVTFLRSPKRKEDIISKTNTPAAPSMSKPEQILIYVLNHLKAFWNKMDLFSNVLDAIEFILFKLNVTPSIDEVENLAHFYAILCRYMRVKNRLRLFMLDAMYCISYKAVPLIKQCLDVWMHILPLAHMGLARSPLVLTFVYLLHFYRCVDYSGRVDNVRQVLSKRYSYQMADWNETKILDMFRDTILNLREIPLEKKMLRLSLILMAKRHGVDWCQKNIVKKLLLLIIEDRTVPERVRCFCVSLLGAVMRPYPKNMRVHCEIVLNQLFVMLEQNPSPHLQEAIFTSLIYLSRHSHSRVVGALLLWRPKQVSPAFEELLKDYVEEKSLKSWQYIIAENIK